MLEYGKLLVLYLCLWCELSGSVFGDKPSRSGRNETVAAQKRVSITGDRLSQNERNRRLIPYATYYVAGGLDHGNSLSTVSPSTAHGEEEQEQNDQSDVSKPVHHRVKPNQPKVPYKSENEYNGYDYQDNTEYSYIPIAYIPGGRGIGYNAEMHYYPNSYYQNPISTENSKHYPTVKPKYATTLAPTTEKKFPFSYLTDYVAQHPTVRNNEYYKYVVTPATVKHQSNYEVKKPTYYQINEPAALPFTTPQSEYLNFRYNLYKTQAPKYDLSTTPSTVEITSPKHYLVNKVVSSSSYPEASQLVHSTTPYAVHYDYPEDQYSQLNPKALSSITKSPEQITQSTKTLMSIMKSQELQYQQVPTQVHYVHKPYIVPTVSTSPQVTFDELLNGYNINKQLPDRITPDNIKQSIKTLSYILQVLQKADSISYYHKPIQPQFTSKEIFNSLKETHPISSIEHNSVSPLQQVDDPYDPYETPKAQLSPYSSPEKPYKDEQSTPGRAGIDYPILSVIPETAFNCKTQRYKGFFADPETKCQVWHYCDLNGGQASFLCPNGTIFNQAALTCDWWFNVKCASTPQLYVLNERLYKYILPVRPSFPEDFSGPLVDQYLTEKFKEVESKRKHKYPTNSTISKNETISNLTSLSEYEIPEHLLSENL